HRGKAIFWLFATVLLGFIFVGCQAYEYHHAIYDLNLKFSSGAYGSLFYMLTGFHGFHVIVGATMLTVILIRLIRGHFTADNHFGFEGAAWYWHFVDVVWLACTCSYTGSDTSPPNCRMPPTGGIRTNDRRFFLRRLNKGPGCRGSYLMPVLSIQPK